MVGTSLHNFYIPGDDWVYRTGGVVDGDLAVYLIGSGVGHPPDVEQVIWELLERIHAATPLDCVFANFDSEQKTGYYTNLKDNELPVHPYRAAPDREVAKEVTKALIQQGSFSAVFAFGCTCEPEVPVLAFDRWYDWVNQREALAKLSEEAGCIAIASAWLGMLISPSGSVYDDYQKLLAGIRLTWTGQQWLQNESWMNSLDIAAFLSSVVAPEPGIEGMQETLKRCQELVKTYYPAGVSRAKCFTREAVKVARQQGDKVIVVFTSVPWIEIIASELTKQQVLWASFQPKNVNMVSILDHASAVLNEVDREKRIAYRIFSGERIPSRVEELHTSSQDWTESRSAELACAGHFLCREYEHNHSKDLLLQAELCVDQALQLHSQNAYTWWLKALTRQYQGDLSAALETIDRSIVLNPSDGIYHKTKADIYYAMRQYRLARFHGVMGIYHSPKDGHLWGWLGYYFSGDNNNAARYCMDQGRKNKSNYCEEQYKLLDNGRAPSWRSCPIELLPPVIWLARHGILAKYASRQAWLRAASVIAVIGMGITGAWIVLTFGGAPDIAWPTLGLILLAVMTALLGIYIFSIPVVQKDIKTKGVVIHKHVFTISPGSLLRPWVAATISSGFGVFLTLLITLLSGTVAEMIFGQAQRFHGYIAGAGLGALAGLYLSFKIIHRLGYEFRIEEWWNKLRREIEEVEKARMKKQLDDFIAPFQKFRELKKSGRDEEARQIEFFCSACRRSVKLYQAIEEKAAGFIIRCPHCKCQLLTATKK